MKIKQGDFIELDYVGRLQEDKKVFDLTSEALAKKEGLFHDHEKYGARIICVGEGNIVKGIDDFLVGKDVGTYTVSLTPDHSFGKKNAKLIKLIPLSIFKKQDIKPFPGLQLNMDGFMGVVRAVSGGRIIMDFNHPLAGRDVEYELTVKRVVTNAEEKIKAYILILFGKELPYSYQQGKLNIEFNLPEPMQKQVADKIKSVLPEVKDVHFEMKKEKEKEQKASSKKTTTQP